VRVLSLNPGHDGAVALVDDGRLIFSLEAEKDSFERHDRLGASLLMAALEWSDGPPDVVAIGGWHKHVGGKVFPVASGYEGLAPGHLRQGTLLGHPVSWFTSTHERSHLHMAAAMGPAAPYDECVILVWEGFVGAFYR
jgi:hydroxymethyl cephem carbamoyltransferase